MKAVVIAAGEGTRMRPLTRTVPKPLLPLGGEPMLSHVFERCMGYVDEFVVVVGYKSEEIIEFYGDEFRGVEITYVHQEEQMGTADAIDCASGVVNERFFVLNADVLFSDELIEELSETTGNAVTVMGVDNPSRYGVLEVESGKAIDIVEKPDAPPSNLANLGFYVFEPEVFRYIDETGLSGRGEYEITQTIRDMIDDNQVFEAVEYSGRWLDVGRPWDLLEANSVVMEGVSRSVKGDVEDEVSIKGDVVVEKGACIKSGSYLEGPVVVKSGADIGPNAYIRGGSVIGGDARVGNAVEVKNSILMDGCSAGHLSYIGDSVLGVDVNLGAGTVVANLRHDDESVKMMVKDELVDTCRRKLGVVLGEGVKTGVNTSLNAGVKLGVDETTLPGEVVMKDKGKI